ncbi:hypothetical protein ACFWBF_26035 [Streptomyces sp. NPDC060028]|uniref:hypothetical protein n=1 Tax=Streptomyces sp. NPDC060028 TaxID=3347041 RepID=UPI0036B06094
MARTTMSPTSTPSGATAKLGMADAMRSVLAAGTNPYADSRQMIQDALSTLMGAGTAAGAIRATP